MEHLKSFESLAERIIVFTNKRNPRLSITVRVSSDSRIVDIENETGIRFPFSMGQSLSRKI